MLKIQATLCVLLVLSPLFSSGEPQAPVVLEEMKVAREAAERRAIQLEAEVSRLKKDLDRIRSSYANLYLESHSSIERLRRMELRAAQMLRQKEGGELEKVSEEALEALEIAGKSQLAVERSLSEFEQALATILDVLRPSDAMRRQLTSRLQALRGAVEESLKPMSVVAGRGVGETTGQGCGVVAVNEKLAWNSSRKLLQPEARRDAGGPVQGHRSPRRSERGGPAGGQPPRCGGRQHRDAGRMNGD